MVLFLVVTAGLLRWPPWPVRHIGRYRGMMGYFLLLAASMLCGRLAALRLGLAANDYFTLECILLAGMSAVEGLRVSRRHLAFALMPLGYAPFIQLLPELRLVLYNLLLTILIIFSIIVHMRQAEEVDRAGWS
jgi:hypothetical protein